MLCPCAHKRNRREPAANLVNCKGGSFTARFKLSERKLQTARAKYCTSVTASATVYLFKWNNKMLWWSLTRVASMSHLALSRHDVHLSDQETTVHMGVGRIFSRGGGSRRFSQNFSRGAKSGEICFLSLEIEKNNLFLLIISKPLRGPSHPPSDARDRAYYFLRYFV